MDTFEILEKTPVSESAVGSEIMLLDQNEEARTALEDLLSEAGFSVTAIGDAARAQILVQEKFYAVVILDMDTPGRLGGVEMAKQARQHAPATRVVMLTERKTFDRAVAGFKAGASGVYAKGENALPDLFEAVVVQVEKDVGVEQRGELLKELLAFMEVFLRHLMQAGRRALRAEEKAGVRKPEEGGKECILVVVDDNAKTGPGLQKVLGKGGAFRVISCLTGGEALDVVSQHNFDIALIKNHLVDMEGTMVGNSIMDMKTGAMVLIFSDLGDEPGSVSRMEGSKVVPLIPKLERGGQLVGKLVELRQEILAKRKERRYLDAFRADYFDLLKNYVTLRRKLTALLPDE